MFPDDPSDWGDLDAYFDKQRRIVLGAVLICNIALLGSVAILAELPALTPRHLVVTWSFFPVAALGIVTTDRRIVMACLVWLIALYPLSVLWR